MFIALDDLMVNGQVFKRAEGVVRFSSCAMRERRTKSSKRATGARCKRIRSAQRRIAACAIRFARPKLFVQLTVDADSTAPLPAVAVLFAAREGASFCAAFSPDCR